jgi:hypothetical protein
MSKMARGQVIRIYPTKQGHLLFRLALPPDEHPGAGKGYFALPKDHKSFEISCSLLSTAAVAGIDISVRTRKDINPEPVPDGGSYHDHDATVAYVFLDFVARPEQ